MKGAVEDRFRLVVWVAGALVLATALDTGPRIEAVAATPPSPSVPSGFV
jgi:hypothetical protein